MPTYPAGLEVPVTASGFEDALKAGIASRSFRVLYQKPGETPEWRECEVAEDRHLTDVLVESKSGRLLKVFDPNAVNPKDDSRGDARSFRVDRILSVHLTHGGGSWEEAGKPVIPEPPPWLDAAPPPESPWG